MFICYSLLAQDFPLEVAYRVRVSSSVISTKSTLVEPCWSGLVCSVIVTSGTMTVCDSSSQPGLTESPIGFSFPERLSWEFNHDIHAVLGKKTFFIEGA
ncbi:hypothetical protein Tco_1580562, partial [Tanacetum coccineum]